jgi:circadian clock protein KaiC
LEKDGFLRLLFTSPKVLMQSLIEPNSMIVRAVQEGGIRRVVVDSLSHFTQLTSDPHELRGVYHQVINAFRREETTAIFLSEEMHSDYTQQEKGRLSFLVDCLVMLRYLEIDSAVQRAIVVLKMRSSAHDTAIHSYTIGQNGITVGKLLEGKSGLLSGLARRSIISTVK